MTDYSEALKYVSDLLRTYTPEDLQRKHKEFVEEGFAGTRHRIRSPFETYSMITYGHPEVDMPNIRLRDALIRMAAESILLLSEYMDSERLALRMFTFENVEDAKLILDILKRKIVADGFVDLHYYYSSIGAKIQLSPVMKMIGWMHLDRVPIKKAGKNYYLDLPKPIELKR